MNQVATKTAKPAPSAVVQQIKADTPLEKLPQKQVSLINMMANKYNMDPLAFSNAVKKTAMPGNATNEEFAAFMMVCKEYNLNPFLREIHAFPKKGGGIVPVVSIDGWVHIINDNSVLDGFDFAMHYDEKANLVACTCNMYRKDRSHPVQITEYMIECYRNTEPWKMKHRMIRHKALIQAARYCFGLGGIYDEDEARDIAEMKDVTPAKPDRPKLQDFVAPASDQNNSTGAAGEGVVEESSASETETSSADATETVDETTGEVTEYGPADAMQRGREDHAAGKARKAIPPEFREPGKEGLAEAWFAGWDDANEITAKPDQTKLV